LRWETVFHSELVALFVFPSIGRHCICRKRSSGCGRPGDSRYQFGSGGGFALWRRSAGDCDDGEIGAGVVDLPLALLRPAARAANPRCRFPGSSSVLYRSGDNTYGPQEPRLSQMFFQVGAAGLTVTLFLIGTGISRATLKEVGWRPLVQGVLLWILVGVTSLYFIRAGWIAL